MRPRPMSRKEGVGSEKTEGRSETAGGSRQGRFSRRFSRTGERNARSPGPWLARSDRQQVHGGGRLGEPPLPRRSSDRVQRSRLQFGPTTTTEETTLLASSARAAPRRPSAFRALRAFCGHHLRSAETGNGDPDWPPAMERLARATLRPSGRNIPDLVGGNAVHLGQPFVERSI